MGDYLSLEEARRWTGAPVMGSDISDLEDAIAAVERQVEQYCQRTFVQSASGPRDFVATNTTLLRLGPFNDLVSASSIKTDDGGGGFTESITGYELEPRNVSGPESRPYTSVRRLDGAWPVAASADARQSLVRITGVWGWPAIPAAVKQATRIQVARIFKRSDSPFGVAGVSEFGVMRIQARLDPDVQHMLDPYRVIEGFA